MRKNGKKWGKWSFRKNFCLFLVLVMISTQCTQSWGADRENASGTDIEVADVSELEQEEKAVEALENENEQESKEIEESEETIIEMPEESETATEQEEETEKQCEHGEAQTGCTLCNSVMPLDLVDEENLVEPYETNPAEEVEINETNFPDAYFRDFVKTYDTDENGFLSQEERENVTEIRIIGSDGNLTEIYSVQGVEYFPNLRLLHVPYSKLTGADLRKNKKIRSVDFGYDTDFKELKCDLTKLTYLGLAGCNDGSDPFKDLDVSDCTDLHYLGVVGLNLTKLDVSKMTELTALDAQNNQLTELDLTNNTKLTHLYIFGNQLTHIDVSQNTELVGFYCFDNYLTEVDISKNTKLTALRVARNAMTNLDVSSLTLDNFIGNDQRLGKKPGQETNLDLSMYLTEDGYVNQKKTSMICP